MHRLLLLLPLLAALLVTNVVRADALPPDACIGAVGETCDTAGPNNDQPGICVQDSCYNEFKDASAPCLLCKQVGDASAPEPSLPTKEDTTQEDTAPVVGSPKPAASSSAPNTELNSSSSCSMPPFGATAGAGGVGLLIMSATTLLFARKRRKE